MNYQEFKNKYNGKYWNYDGYYGYQCWDLVAFYLQEVLNVPVYVISDYQNAINNLNSDFFKYFEEVNINSMIEGDICIWTDSLHICLYDHWNGVTHFLSQDANARPTGIYSQVTSGHYFRAFRKKQPKPLFIIEKVPTKIVKYKIDAKLWDLNFTSFNNAVYYDTYKKDKDLEVGAIATHVVGSKYYISKYDYDNKINNGVNVDDCYDYFESSIEVPIVEKPVVDVPNKSEPEVPQETTKDDEQTNTLPATETPENSPQKEEKSTNTLISIVLFILKTLAKLLKGGK